MNKTSILILTAALALGVASFEADAAGRFGGGSNLGKQSSSPAMKQAPNSAPAAPAKTAAPAATPPAPVTPPPQPSFMSRFGGIIAGLGIGALLGSLLGGGGLGGGLGILLMVLAFVANEDGYEIASVRFAGLMREAADANPEPFDEVWHVRKKIGDKNSHWLIAGIQQLP